MFHKKNLPSVQRHAALGIIIFFIFTVCLPSISIAAEAQKNHASSLPSDQYFQKLIDDTHKKFIDEKGGKNADYIPALAKVEPDLFGIAIVTADGKIFTAGDAGYSFAIESVSKPFTMALVMQNQGAQAVRNKIGVEPTGLAFNSIMAIELISTRSVNPLVNAGAIASVSMIKASDSNKRWDKILNNLNRFAGEKLSLLKDVYRSEAASNQHNKGIAELLASYDRLYCDPLEATDVYTRQCSVGVTIRQLAIMGSVFANNGVHPVTGVRLLNSEYVPKALAVMQMAGFYNASGDWAFETGLPSKTGVGGGIFSVVPGKMTIAAFSPPLDRFGNSVRAQKAIQYIAGKLNYNIFR